MPAFSLRFQRHKGHRISLETFWFGLEQKHQKGKGSEWCTQTETANPSSEKMQPRSQGLFPRLGAGQAKEKSLGTSLEKMTTIARIIGLKGMPIGKTLAGSFSSRLQTKNDSYYSVPLHFIIFNCKYKDNPEFHCNTHHFNRFHNL